MPISLLYSRTTEDHLKRVQGPSEETPSIFMIIIKSRRPLVRGPSSKDKSSNRKPIALRDSTAGSSGTAHKTRELDRDIFAGSLPTPIGAVQSQLRPLYLPLQLFIHRIGFFESRRPLYASSRELVLTEQFADSPGFMV